MNRRALLLMLLIFGLLSVIAILQSQPAANPTLDDLRATATALGTPIFTQVFPGLAVLDIQAIRLRNPDADRALTITRAENDVWTIPNNEAGVSLDADTASTIARTIVLLHYQRTLPLPEDGDLTGYGFNPSGILFVEVLLKTGEGHIVAVGALSGQRTTYYALVDDRQEIYLLERAPVDFLITQLAHPPLT